MVEQHSEELHGSPRPMTPQTPNTPLSPQGEELPDPQSELLNFGAQLPTSASHTVAPAVRSVSSQPKVLIGLLTVGMYAIEMVLVLNFHDFKIKLANSKKDLGRQ